MEVSQQIHGSHATPSPCGQYVASIDKAKLKICSTSAPDRFTTVSIRTSKNIFALTWNDDSRSIAVAAAQCIEILDLDDSGHRIRLDNGSGSLGQFASVEFVGSGQLLVLWEFGKTKLFDTFSGKAIELADVKTSSAGQLWQMRPSNGNTATQTLAALERSGAEDILNVYLPAAQKQIAATKIGTLDAQSLSWSPDGRWLAVLDTPTAGTSVHIFTPDGHRFRSYPPISDSPSSGLGVKSCVWSNNSPILALTKYDGKIILLNAQTFVPIAMIEHTTAIDQRTIPEEQQAPVWQESVLASGERSYSGIAQPVSPSLTRVKPTTEPNELGVAEACFSSDGSYLASRDERMLNTVWIWNMATLTTHAVLIQHSNVKRLHWHPTRPQSLLVDCAEGIAYAFDAGSGGPPVPMPTSMPGIATMSWLHTTEDARPAILLTAKSSFRILYTEGLPTDSDRQVFAGPASTDAFDEGASDDSIFDVLSGRKPMPVKTDQSYTERLDFEVETEEENLSTHMDDTFREKRVRKSAVVDPFDDSQIF